MRRRSLFTLAVAAGLITAATGGAAAASSSTSGATLVVATADGVQTFDPSTSSSTEVAYLANVYQGLTYASPNGTILPELATSWSHSKDGLTWIFHLRHGVRFHDGSLMTSLDVVRSIERTMKLNQGEAFIWQPVRQISAVGPYTVRFRLKHPAALDRIASAEYSAWIMGPKAWNEPTAYFNTNTPHEDGTGPYTIALYKPGQQIVLKAFPQYWGGWKGPHYTTVVFDIIQQSAVQQEMLQGGQAQIANAIPTDSLKSVTANPELRVLSGPSFYYYLAYFNTKVKPLNNVWVRRALAYAIPYQQIVQVATSGYGVQMQGPLPYHIYPHDYNLPKYTYNLAKARELLAKAGYPHGGFSLTLTYASENPSEALFAPLIKESFAKLGISVTIRPLAFSEQWAIGTGNPLKAQDIFLLLTWPTYDDDWADLEVNYACQHPTSWNLAYYCNPTYDALLKKAISLEVTQPATAQRLFDQAQQILVSDSPVAFLYDAPNILVANRSVAGYTDNPAYPFVIFLYPLHPAG